MRIREIIAESTLVGYHGSNKINPVINPNHGITYLTSNPEVASSYGEVISKYGVTMNNPAVVNGYGGNWDGFSAADEITIGNIKTTVGEVFLPDVELDNTDTVEFSSIVSAIRKKYPRIDGVICKNIVDSGANTAEPLASDVYAIFNPRQAKFIR